MIQAEVLPYVQQLDLVLEDVTALLSSIDETYSELEAMVDSEEVEQAKRFIEDKMVKVVILHDQIDTIAKEVSRRKEGWKR